MSLEANLSPLCRRRRTSARCARRRRPTTARSPTAGGADTLTFVVADPAEHWSALGFTVTGDCCRVGDVVFALGAEGHGIQAWSAAAVDGLASVPEADAAVATHPNGIVALDHIVVTTPDHQRTLDALAGAGLELRRVREAGPSMVQGFFRVGPTVLEVVGPAVASGDGPARFWGLAFTATDLDATAAFLGGRLHPPKDAVQPGRRIATLAKDAGSSVPIAVMSLRP